MTKQLRLQEKYSMDNGFKPELIINRGAKLSEPLKKSSFEIKFYTPPPAVDATGHAAFSDPTKIKPVIPQKGKSSYLIL